MTIDDNVVISTHQMVYGASQALRDFLINKKQKNILYIGLPLLENRNYEIEEYQKGKLSYKNLQEAKNTIYIWNYIWEFIFIITNVLKQKKTYDVFIGVDVFNCLAGIFLKKLGKVKKVGLYSIDFSPIRFKNKLLNYIYHSIEKISVRDADIVWNVSPRIAVGREEFLGIQQDDYPQAVVPIGIWTKNIKNTSDHFSKHQIFFVGHLLEKQGVQLVLEAINFLKKQYKDISLVIVGGGEYEKILKEKTKKLRIEKHVKFLGWIKDKKRINQYMLDSSCAVAVYQPEKERKYNFTYYADPTKIKDYLAAGLPIILTNISYNAEEIQRKECGIIVEYNHQEIVKAIKKLFDNEKILRKYRKNALIYAEQFNWEVIFNKAFYGKK